MSVTREEFEEFKKMVRENEHRLESEVTSLMKEFKDSTKEFRDMLTYLVNKEMAKEALSGSERRSSGHSEEKNGEIHS